MWTPLWSKQMTSRYEASGLSSLALKGRTLITDRDNVNCKYKYCLLSSVSFDLFRFDSCSLQIK